MVRLFLHHVWKLYSLPNCIISDRGSQFVALFTKKLYCLLRVDITPLIAWYLQLDRQTEQVNQKLNQCHMQVHLSETYIPMVISSPNYTSLPSTAVTFLATRLTVVLQPSGYSIFHSGDTPIQLGLPWWSYSCQCFNTETSDWSNRGFTTETLSIFYNIYLYIRLVVIL